jgi:hypothetical protein
MQINLKQPEIEQALRAYVNAQGISLYQKDVSISFTAGRRESGISAEISIEDVEIPGYTNDTPTPAPTKAAPVLTLAPAAVEAVEAEEAPVPQEPVGAEPGEVPAAAEEAPAAEPKATVSLFG